MRKLSKTDKVRAGVLVKEGGKKLLQFSQCPHRYQMSLERSPNDFFGSGTEAAAALDGDVPILYIW